MSVDMMLRAISAVGIPALRRSSTWLVYSSEPTTALAKIVGLEVTPLMASSVTRRASSPESSMALEIWSDQMLTPWEASPCRLEGIL